MNDQSMPAKVARELMDGALRGFADEGVEITSTGPVEKGENGDWGFAISGDANGAMFDGTVSVTLIG